MDGPPATRYAPRHVKEKGDAAMKEKESPKDKSATERPGAAIASLRHYRELLWHTLVRQTLLYFLPLLLLAVFFHVQYRSMIRESHRAHLTVIAEQQATTLDLFLRERLVNLANLIDDPQFESHEMSEVYLQQVLSRLRQTSPAFVDVGVVDDEGELVAYAGPVDFRSPVHYGKEPWFQRVREGEQTLVTDIYLGFRSEPHFTLAVKRERERGMRVVRSALLPEQLLALLETLEGAQEVNAAVVNAHGVFQVVTERVGTPLGETSSVPPREPNRGFVEVPGVPGAGGWAYAWLSETPWALVVHERPREGSSAVLSPQNWLLGVTVLFFLGMGLVIFVRARQLVGKQLAAEQHEAELSGQLVHAAKLASVGELAAGIAHEINNPLAIIAEEVGMLKDTMNPEFGDNFDRDELAERLDIIHEAVFRCRDITRKLLTFVRQTDIKIDNHEVESILDDVIGGMLSKELLLGNVDIIKDYDPEPRPVQTDRNQLVQVFLNLVKNAVDAMPTGGTLTVRTKHGPEGVTISVRDTGTGMTEEQMKRAFLPFFTTKPPGKGTGLGLSVSASILKNFGGNMYVESAPGKGSTFTVELPYEITA